MFFRFKTQNNKGFTILEMVVVAGIFVVVTGIILANLPQFRNRASLDLTAQEVALSIREAQVYGTATRIAGDTYPSYGIHFELTDGPATSFILFTDDNKNGLYDRDPDNPDSCGTVATECLDKYLIDGRFFIKALCVNGVSQDNCASTDAAADIVFTRPFPEPTICVNIGSNNSCDNTNITIILSGPNNPEQREILVWNNGQITATNDGH